LGRGLIALDVESVGVTEAANARHEDSLPCVDLRRARATTAGAPAAIRPLSRSWATTWQAPGKVAPQRPDEWDYGDRVHHSLRM
jgi:hypothetical protein